MKKTLLKKIASIVTVMATILNILTVGMISSSAISETFIAPEFSETPELLYQITKPVSNAPVYSENFTPALLGDKRVDGAPVISGITSSAFPNESIVIEGENFSDGTVWIYGLDSSGVGEFAKAAIINQSDTTVTAIVPVTFDYGMYLIWIENKNGQSYPVRVNTATAKWLSDTEVEPGDEISVYGENLSFEKGTDESHIYVINDLGYEISIIPDSVNPYKVTFRLPDSIDDGEYTVFVHNGHGGEYGWSSGLEFTVKNGTNDIWMGKIITVNKQTKTVSVNTGDFTVGGSSVNNRLQIGGKDLLINLSTTQTKVYTDTDSTQYLYYNNKKIPITINGSSLIVDGGDQELLEVAVCIAQNRDTVFIKNGTYTTNRMIRVVQAVRFMGESKDETVIVASFGSEVNKTSVNNNNLFLVCTFPSAFEKLTFEDDVSSVFSPKFVYANGYSTDGTSGWVRDGFATDYCRISDCSFIKHKTYCSDGTKDYNVEGYQGNVAVTTEDGTTTTYSAGSSLIQECLTVSSVSNITVSDCYFQAPRGMSFRGASTVTVENNTACGTWIMDGTSGPCFVQFFSADNVDCNNNIVYGYDKVADPNGSLKKGDQTFDRVIVFQNSGGDCDNIYIGENEFERCGTVDDNSGEQIMFEGTRIVYQGKPSDVSKKSISFNDAEWHVDSNGNILNTYNSLKLVGCQVLISNGKGVSQYRTVVDANADNGEFTLILDREWDIAPTTESLVEILTPFSDAVIYNNEIDGLDDYYQEYNATAGIQAYGSMLDVVIDGNKFTNLASGILITARYTESDKYTEVNKADCAFFQGVIIENNIIENTRCGIGQRFVWQTVEGNYTASFKDEAAEALAEQNTVIRNNVIKNCVYSEASSLVGIGGEGICVGRFRKTYATWSEDALPASAYIKNTVIENNSIESCASACINICYAQGDTILRNNTYGVDDITVQYDQSELEGAPPPIEVINYNDITYYGTAENGIYVKDAETAVSELTPLNEFNNADFSMGLKYWAPKTDSTGFASDYVSVENGALKLDGSLNQFSGVRSVSFSIPIQAYNKKIVINYDICSNAKVGFNLYSDVSSLTGWQISNNSTNGTKVNVTSTVDNALQLQEGDKTLSIEVQLFGTEDTSSYAYIDNLKLYYIDEGGLNLPAELDGAPVKFEYCDANADGTVDIRDLIRIKKYISSEYNSNEVPIYIAAANADKGSDLSVNAGDLVSVRHTLLN